MSPQHYPHAKMKADIQQALIRAIADADLDWDVLTEATVSFADGFEPMPDIVVIDAGMTPNAYRTIPALAVRLIVEVGDSTLADNLGDKRLEYAQAGLAEYWVVDVQGRAVIRHAQPGVGGYLNEAAPVPVSQPIAMLTQPAVAARV